MVNNSRTFSYFISVSWEDNGGRRGMEFIQGNCFILVLLRGIVRSLVLVIRDWRNQK